MATQVNQFSPEPPLRFRTGAALLIRLGSEQLKDEITALMELVKNAYDADATGVVIEFQAGEDGLRIIIQDDGSGMTREDLDSKWAFLATENKVREDRSPLFKRRRLGQKGVGRFATEKLGRSLVLRTRTNGEDRILQVRFNWDDLRPERELADYAFQVSNKKPEPYEPPHGTRLDIRNLRNQWPKLKIEKLRSHLANLIDPETATSDFTIRLVTPWTDLNGILTNPLPGNETHRIEFELRAEGTETIRTYTQGPVSEITRNIASPMFGAVSGRIRYYGQGLKMIERGRGVDQNVDWNMGVRIFRDGCRVRPYGEPGPDGDWLQIYRARYQRGSRFRLKPHYLQGTVHITKEGNPYLRDTTSREGVVENECFDCFVDYVQQKLAELSELVRVEEQQEERHRVHERYQRALSPLTNGLSELRSEAYRRAVEDADKQVKKSFSKSLPEYEVRNAHWQCLDCTDAWKAPREKTPTCCREFSVGKDGKPSLKPGCGSTNIKRKENLPRNNPTPAPMGDSLEDVMVGMPAYVAGVQLRPIIDWEMGENDEEAEVRPEARQLAINGRHPAFRAADQLDGRETVEGTDFESLRAVAGLTVHIIEAAAYAWGVWHYNQSGEQFDKYQHHRNALRQACLQKLDPVSAETDSD